jgi:hypothetical protein
VSVRTGTAELRGCGAIGFQDIQGVCFGLEMDCDDGRGNRSMVATLDRDAVETGC